MDPIRTSGQNQRSELTRSAKPPPGKLTAEDIARLRAKREEIILVLRHWHGYSQIAADRVFRDWLYHNSLPRAQREEDSAWGRSPDTRS